MALLLLSAALLGGVPVPRSAAPASRWEGYVLHLAATLRAQQLSGLHFLCRSHCVTDNTLRRLERDMTLAYTISMRGAVPSTWPVTTRNLFVLVGLDCGALANVTLHTRDVVVMASFPSQKVLLARAADAFESCWRLDILDAVAVAPAGGGGLALYTYLPYRAGQCHNMRPLHVADWAPGGAAHRSLGLVAKVRDLGGCPLRVTVLQARPYTDLVNTTAGLVLRGTHAPLLFSLARHMNFTPVMSQPTDGTMYGNPAGFPKFGGLLGDLFHNQSDFSLAFSPNDVQMPHHGRPPTAQTTCTTWCLPTGYRHSSAWRPVVGEFSPQTWAAVLASYLVAALSHCLLFKTDRVLDSMLAALQSLVSSTRTMPLDWAPRSFMFCWSFSGLVLATVYMAALHSINSTETVDTLFRNVAELSDSPLPVYSSTDQLRNFKKAQLDAHEKALMARVHVFEYSQALPMFRRFFAAPDIGILSDRNACQAWALLFTPPRKAPRFHVIRNYCFAVSMAHNLVLRRRSPLLRPFSEISSRLDEAGLTMHWLDTKVLNVAHTPAPVMGLRQLLPFLKVLGIGLSAASIAFLMELFAACSSSCHRTARELNLGQKDGHYSHVTTEYEEIRKRVQLEFAQLDKARLAQQSWEGTF